MSKHRPAFAAAWAAFKKVNVPVKQVGKLLGGHVQMNTDMSKDGFENACPIRMSYVLNYTGFPIRSVLNIKMVTGADGKNYIFRVNDMARYLEFTLGKPDKTVSGRPKPSDFANMKGIVLIKGHGWGDASGNTTLWNGNICSDTCHLTGDPMNGRFLPESASIWTLK